MAFVDDIRAAYKKYCDTPGPFERTKETDLADAVESALIEFRRQDEG